MTAFGEMSITSITLFYVLLSVPLSLMRCTNGWAILSNRSNPSVILLIKKGFYVYAKPSSCDPETAIKYIGRYLGRPVIATSRIDKYDGSMVTFHYNRHEDDKYIQETIPVMDFIKRLIRHIPEKHFKMIRYGGLYARHRKTDQQLHKVISKQKRPILRNFNHWRNAILSSFGYDPLECPICRHKMEFLELYFNHQRLSLEELYERSMSRSRGKRSSA